MQYSYDSLILKEHRRRLNIKNAQLNFKAKYSLDINSIVDNFRLTQENNSKNYFLNSRRSNQPNNQNALNHRNSLNKKFKQEISKANFDKIELDEEEIEKLKLKISNFQTENTKREPRRLNNFKIDFNILHDNKDNKKSKNLFTKKIKNLRKSKSIDIVPSRKSNALYLTSCILISKNENSALNEKLIKDSNDDSVRFRKRTNSFMHSKNDKFYAMTLFKEESFMDLIDDESLFFSDNKETSKINKILDENFDLYEENLELLNEFSNGNNQNCDKFFNNNKDDKCNFSNSALKNNNFYKANSSVFESDLDFARSNSYKKKCNQDVFAKNKNYFNIENLNNDNDKNYNKTYCLEEKAKENFDSSYFSTQETNNYTDIHNERNSGNIGTGSGKMKTRRNQVLSGILNCDIKLGSAQITITDLDKTSLRKGRGSICNTTINIGDESFKESGLHSQSSKEDKAQN
jgi:hypothetical protein